MIDTRYRFQQYVGETATSFSIALQDMKRHALRRLGADAWKAAQAINQFCQQIVVHWMMKTCRFRTAS